MINIEVLLRKASTMWQEQRKWLHSSFFFIRMKYCEDKLLHIFKCNYDFNNNNNIRAIWIQMRSRSTIQNHIPFELLLCNVMCTVRLAALCCHFRSTLFSLSCIPPPSLPFIFLINTLRYVRKSYWSTWITATTLRISNIQIDVQSQSSGQFRYIQILLKILVIKYDFRKVFHSFRSHHFQTRCFNFMFTRFF